MNKLISAFLFSSLVLACGGDSGPSNSTLLKNLSESEERELCREAVASFPVRTVTCSGQSVTVGIPASECTAAYEAPAAACAATVGEAKACFEAFGDLTDAQICMGETSIPAVCAKLNNC